MRVGVWNVLKMVVFRENMGSMLFFDTAERIFGKNLIDSLDGKIKQLLVNREENPVALRKVEYAKDNVSLFQIFNFVKFVGISGSVAAGFAQDDDDIDIFIVVRNGTGWLYRGLLLAKNIFNRKIRMGGGLSRRHTGLGGRFKDKFCVNLIVEERGLHFDEDLFIFHELLHIIPIYNEPYLERIIGVNSWIRKFGYSAKEDSDVEKKQSNIAIRILNWIMFAAQLIYRTIMLHPTNLKEILGSYKEGQITFYPKDFRSEILEQFEKRYEQRVQGLFGPKYDSNQ